MMKAIVMDFSRVLLFPNDETYSGSLNGLHKQLSSQENYNPLDHFHLNVELLEYLDSLKSKIDLSMFTSDVIQDDPSFQSFLKPIFRKIFSASKLNIQKDNPKAYKEIVLELQQIPQDVLYVDDNLRNIEAAATAGLPTIHYRNNRDYLRRIQEIIS